MSKKRNGVKHSKTSSAVRRRKSVIFRLQAQLFRGNKMTKTDPPTIIELEESDIKRINKEIVILKERIYAPNKLFPGHFIFCRGPFHR